MFGDGATTIELSEEQAEEFIQKRFGEGAETAFERNSGMTRMHPMTSDTLAVKMNL